MSEGGEKLEQISENTEDIAEVAKSALSRGINRGVKQEFRLKKIWQPHPENNPQQLAYNSKAQVIGYGGAAGGGKTDFAIGSALTQHKKSIIFRREYPQLKDIMARAEGVAGKNGKLNRVDKILKLDDGTTCEFGAMQYESDKEKYQGRDHDLKVYDEATHFTRSQIEFTSAWNRTHLPNQHCKILLTWNPPKDIEEEWVIDYFAPWVDEDYDGPGGRAESGEIRYAYVIQEGDTYKDVWVDSPQPVTVDGQEYEVKSRTFIFARVQDNKFMMDTGYDKTLKSLPTELRTRMYDGFIRRVTKDAPLQIISREHLKLAQKRWIDFHESGEKLASPCTQIGADVSRGGNDRTCISKRYGTYFAPIKKLEPEDTTTGEQAAQVIYSEVEDGADVALDALNVGWAVLEPLQKIHPNTIALESTRKSSAKDKSGTLGFVNKRAEWWWALKEALHPETGEDLMIPDDPELSRELLTPRYKITARGVKVEDKSEIKSRLQGRSPDKAESLVYANADLDLYFSDLEDKKSKVDYSWLQSTKISIRN